MTITWQAVGVIIAILSHAGFMVWWASKLTVKLETVNTSLLRLDRELEKRDTQLAAAWKKIDGLNTRLTVVETKVKIHNHEEER